MPRLVGATVATGATSVGAAVGDAEAAAAVGADADVGAAGAALVGLAAGGLVGAAAGAVFAGAGLLHAAKSVAPVLAAAPKPTIRRNARREVGRSERTMSISTYLLVPVRLRA
ncbi:MAG: hypothetical protein M3069_27750, partial [Chloroflexota bacterium]|nr:hypothetical protein [Chloroflexota bacterium]